MQNLKENKFVILFKKGVSLIMVLLFLMSCNENVFDTEEDLMSFIQDEANGYSQHKTVNGVDFILVYKPLDLIVAQELKNTSSKDNVDSLRNKYKEFLYLNLYMSKDNKELLSVLAKNRSDFSSKVSTLVYNMNEKVNLISKKKDTIGLIDYVYPRMYGMSNSTSIMFVYPRDDNYLNDEYVSFTIEDLGINTGEVKFKIETKYIKSEPKLSFKN